MSSKRVLGWSALACVIAVLLTVLAYAGAEDIAFRQVNLVSDVDRFAPRTDPNLVNAWGLAITPANLVWVANAGTGVSTVYYPDGRPAPTPSHPLIVEIPSPSEEASEPTGLVRNPTRDFVVTKGHRSGPSVFLFATEDGTIAGWNPEVDLTHAIQAVDNSGSEANYKGIALGRNPSGNVLFATNFHEGVVDMFDGQFHQVGSFTDPTVPDRYAPFGIRNIGGLLFVTFARQAPDREDDDPGAGHGFVDVFDTTGHMLRRLVSHGALNSPWGLVVAPDDLGRFGRALLVGNFGDGRINAFDRRTGDFMGPLRDERGNPIAIDGLWGLNFLGREDVQALYFTAGPRDERHGLLGRLVPVW